MEKWVDIPGYENYYQVSNMGRVRSLPRFVPHARNNGRLLKGKVLKPRKNKPGYVFVSLYRNGSGENIQIHQLVMMSFIGYPPEGYCVNHKNGIKTDNSLSNLEYVTYKENQRHRIDILGNHNKGERHGMSKLSPDSVRAIRILKERGKTQEFIAHEINRIFGTSIKREAVGKILRGERWGHVQ